MRVQVKEKYMKRRLFRKPVESERWVTIIHDSRETNLTQVRHKKDFYESHTAKTDMMVCINEVTKTHTERI